MSILEIILYALIGSLTLAYVIKTIYYIKHPEKKKKKKKKDENEDE